MKTKLLVALLVAGVIAVPVRAQESERTLGETAGEIIDKATKQKKKSSEEESTKSQDIRVKVTISEGELDLPNRLQPGRVTFSVTNSGEEKHGFAVSGGDVDQMIEGKIKPGETRTLRANLDPGSYSVYCPEHKGERISLKVREK
jgi:hypothetical protein